MGREVAEQGGQVMKSQLKLVDIVRAIVVNDGIAITDEDIVQTVKFLIQDNVCRSPKAFNRIVKMVKEEGDWEDAGV